VVDFRRQTVPSTVLRVFVRRFRAAEPGRTVMGCRYCRRRKPCWYFFLRDICIDSYVVSTFEHRVDSPCLCLPVAIRWHHGLPAHLKGLIDRVGYLEPFGYFRCAGIEEMNA